MGNMALDDLHSCDVSFQEPVTESSLCNRSVNADPENEASCYTCSGRCVYKAVELVYFIGVIANIFVISRVIVDKKLQKPTFIAIACLALSDAIFVSVELVLVVNILVRNLTQCPVGTTNIPTEVFALLAGTSWFAANGHLALLAIVRFVMIVYPFKAHIYLTSKKVLIFSVCIWIFSLTVFSSKLIYDKVAVNKTKTHLSSPEVLFIMWSIAYFIPVLTTCILHSIKLRMVRRALRYQHTKHNNRLGQRMTSIILFVIFCAFVFPLPRFIFDVLRQTKFKNSPSHFSPVLYDVGIWLFYLNNNLNPFIYALFSVSFRRSIRNMLKYKDKGQIECRSNETSTRSMNSTRTSVKLDSCDSDVNRTDTSQSRVLQSHL